MPQHPPRYNESLIQRLSQLIYRCLEDLGSTKAALYLMEPNTRAFDLVSHYGWPRTQPPPERLGPMDPLLVLVSRERRGFQVTDAKAYPELAAFGLGSAQPRYLVSPIYDRGDWRGLLIQRDPTKGSLFTPAQQEAAVQTLCEEIVEAIHAFPAPVAYEPAPSETPRDSSGAPGEEVPPLRVPAPPSGAMTQLDVPAHPVEGAALEKIEVSVSGEASLTALSLPAAQPPLPDLPPADAEAFIPEQQTFFWEAANLLCQMVPTAAVALWLNDGPGARPLLIYSRLPLSTELKQQIIAQTLAQVPHLNREELRLLTKSEWFEREPIHGDFATLLPVLLEEEGGGDNLLMLFRQEDRPFSLHEQDLVRQVARMLGFYLQEAGLHERYHQAFLSVSRRILASAAGRIPAIKEHSVNIAEDARDLAKKVDLPTSEVEAVSISAILHDVGTLLLDYRVLDKPRLSPEELAKVRTHPILASTFLRDLYFPFDVLNIIRHHHEHWNGKGYPDGLKGEDIPMGSRIIHLVEAYEMMISETPYRPAKTEAEALAEMEHLSGSQFDPLLVAQFIQLIQSRH